jgi:hypothetical protein
MTKITIAIFLVVGLMTHRILDAVELDSDGARVVNALLFIALCASAGFLCGSAIAEVLA